MALACAQVVGEHLLPLAGCLPADGFQGQHVGMGQVRHVDIIPQARPVRRGVIVPVDR